MAADEVTWKKPVSIAVTVGWGIMNASIVLNAFLSGRIPIDWYDSLLLFFASVFAGALLTEMKTIVLGIFEALFLGVAIAYFCMVLPVIVGNVAGYYFANVVYYSALTNVFWAFFPFAAVACFLGGMIGGFARDWIF